jgi:ATP-dependent DNA helicase RecG
MVVEHAERFGLSALHQLRGRVGRGPLQSYAFLVYGEALTEDGIARLRTMKETTDGFRIAEEDLKIRGPGELLGARQSGYLRLAIADLVRDADVLLRARDDVTALLEDDPGLLAEENRPVREVLARAAAFRDEMLDGG